MITSLTVLSGTAGAAAVAAGPTNLVMTQDASNVYLTPGGGATVDIPAATDTLAGVLDATRATTIDGLKPVALSGSYNDLTNQPVIPKDFGFTFIIDGGGAAITTGLKGFLISPMVCVINWWSMIADVSGSISVDVWKANLTVPNAGNSITGGAPPSLTAAQAVFGQGNPLTVWGNGVNVVQNDVLAFNVNSTGGVIQRVTVLLKVTHS